MLCLKILKTTGPKTVFSLLIGLQILKIFLFQLEHFFKLCSNDFDTALGNYTLILAPKQSMIEVVSIFERKPFKLQIPYLVEISFAEWSQRKGVIDFQSSSEYTMEDAVLLNFFLSREGR